MNTAPYDDFKVDDLVFFNSIHGDFGTGNRVAKITEIRKNKAHKDIFPLGLAFCIQYQDDLRYTWCRIDELTKVKTA